MSPQTTSLMGYLKLPPAEVEIWPSFALAMLSEPQFGLVQHDNAYMQHVRKLYERWMYGNAPTQQDWHAVLLEDSLASGTSLQQTCAANATESLALAAIGNDYHLATSLVKASGTQGVLTQAQFDNIMDGDTPFLQMYKIKARAKVEQLQRQHYSRSVEVDL